MLIARTQHSLLRTLLVLSMIVCPELACSDEKATPSTDPKPEKAAKDMLTIRLLMVAHGTDYDLDDMKETLQEIKEKGKTTHQAAIDGVKFQWELLPVVNYSQVDGKRKRTVTDHLWLRSRVDGTDVITTQDFSWINPHREERGDWKIQFKLTKKAGKRFADLTGLHIGHKLAIVVGNEIRSAPIIQAVIRESGVITGGLNQQEAEAIRNHWEKATEATE